jgi:hypothetical protein
MRFRAILLTCLAILIVVALLWLLQHTNDYRNGPEHSWRLENAPPFLTDELALQKAAEALALDEPDRRWQPKEDGRTVDPDQKRDKYLCRNGLNPNQGVIFFLQKSEETSGRFVSIKLHGDRVTCQVTKPK